MTHVRQAARSARLLVICAALLLSQTAAAPRGAVAAADTLYGLVTANTLIRFSSASPATIDQTTPITGLPAGTTLVGIDVQPRTGQLYGIGITGTAGSAFGWLYMLNPATGAATAVGPAPFYTELTATARFSMDFSPVVDRIRMVNNLDVNLRVNPNNGTLTGHDMDLHEVSHNPHIVSLAYDRPIAGGGTTLYAIDFIQDKLMMIGGVNGSPSPNLGLVSPIGPLGLTTQTTNIGFDIAADGRVYASLKANANYGLYTINLATGTASLIGLIDTGAVTILDIAVKMHFDNHLPLAFR